MYLYSISYIKILSIILLKGPIIRGDTLLSLGNDNHLCSTQNKWIKIK